jgi:hypothetical protein
MFLSFIIYKIFLLGACFYVFLRILIELYCNFMIILEIENIKKRKKESLWI